MTTIIFIIIAIVSIVASFMLPNYFSNNSVDNILDIAGFVIVPIGIAGLIGKLLNRRDMKRGYCSSAIDEEKFEEYERLKEK
jgi:purine-cytosine permease-like protein